MNANDLHRRGDFSIAATSKHLESGLSSNGGLGIIGKSKRGWLSYCKPSTRHSEVGGDHLMRIWERHTSVRIGYFTEEKVIPNVTKKKKVSSPSRELS